MSDETRTSEATQEATVENLPPLPLLNLTRNGVEYPLSTFKLVKGDKKGARYYCPDITSSVSSEDSWKLTQQFIGLPVIAACVQRMLKNTFQDLFFDNIDTETGILNQGKFLTEGAEFTEAGMKLKEIRTLLAETEETNAQNLAAALKNNALFTDAKWQKTMEDGNNMRSMYKAMEEKRSRKGKADVEPEAAVAVA